MTVMSEDEYKELLALKHQLQRAEDSDKRDQEIENFKNLVFIQIAGLESRIADLEDLRGVYQEVLEGL